MQAMEELAKLMDKFHQTEVAGQIAVSGSELDEIYRRNEQLVRELEENVEQYFEAFECAHEIYRQASRQQTKIERKVREAARRLERKHIARNQRA